MVANSPPRGPHSKDHLVGIVGDHYKIEDVDFLLQ